MSPEHFQEVLKLCEAAPANASGMQELPDRVTLTLYVARDSVGLTIPAVDAVWHDNLLIRARTTKGELYVLALGDVFSASISGAIVQSRAPRRAGFA